MELAERAGEAWDAWAARRREARAREAAVRRWAAAPGSEVGVHLNYIDATSDL